MRFIPTTKLKDFIEERLDVIDIFAYYLGISANDIIYCLADRANKIKNPLRGDKHASLGFMYNQSGKLRMKDFGDDLYTGDVYDIVGLQLGLNSNNPRDFIRICNTIIENVYLHHFNYIPTPTTSIPTIKHTKTIEVVPREYNNNDFHYWKYIPYNILKSFVIPVKHLFVNNSNYPMYKYTKDNPCYAYYFGKKDGIDIYQTYCPYGTKGNKFRTNNTGLFHGTEKDFTDSDTLVITKSVKDKVYWKYLLYLASFFSIGSIASITAFSSESVLLGKDVAFQLSNLYDRVIINADYDKAGLQCMFYHTMCYNYEVITFGRHISNVKFTDMEKYRFIEKVSKDSGRNITISMLNEFIESLADDNTDKDLYDYTIHHGKEKAITKILTIYE